MLRQPGFSLTAIVVLAVGIGFNSAVFSLAYAVLLRPLPYHEPEQLHILWAKMPALQKDKENWAAPDYLDLKQQAKSFSGVVASRLYTSNVTIGRDTERVRNLLVSPDYLPLLGRNPVLGRHFMPDESRIGRGNVVILSEGYWESRFGRDPNVLGRQILLDREPHVVVGVLPYQLGEYNRPEIYSPYLFAPQELTSRRYKNVMITVRLKPGVTAQQAGAELRTLADAFQKDETDERRRWQPVLEPVHEHVVGNSRQPLTMLGIAVGMVLVIACANLANLLLVRASGRIRELALRAALGAGRWRILRQMLVESATLGLAGGAAGLVVAYWTVRAITRMEFAAIQRLDQAGLNIHVILFTLLVSLLSSVVFGLAPAWIALSMNLSNVLKDEARGSSGSRTQRKGRALLVVGEVALSVVLLISAGLLIRTFAELDRADLGYNPRGLLVTRVLTPPRYATEASRLNYATRVIEQLNAVPGVKSAGYAATTPMMGLSWRAELQVPDRQVEAGKGEAVPLVTASPGYFETMGARLKAGRFFTPGDRLESEKVAVISEQLEKLYFPRRDSVGKLLRCTFLGVDLELRIAGVVGDMKYLSPDESPRAILYLPQTQHPYPHFSFVVRTDGDPQRLMGPMRYVLSSVDPDVPAGSIDTMQSLAERLFAKRRLVMNLLLLFSLLAMGLAAFGLYAVLSITVRQRSREIGVRLAMGAGRDTIVRMVVGQGLRLTACGAAAGLLLAPLATRALTDLLFRVKPLDPITYVSVAVFAFVIALLASWFPARQAASVDPATALRKD